MSWHGMEKRRRRWCLMDLVTDPISGRLAETKIWSNAGKALMCWVMWHETVEGTITEPLLLWFAAAVLGHEAITRFMNIKREQGQQPVPGTVETTSQSTVKVTP